MLFGIFSSPEQKLKAQNEKLLQQSVYLREHQKEIFRDNAIHKLKYTYPDIEVCYSMQCQTFVGYSPKSSAFVWGDFFDNLLPDTELLQDKILSDGFPEHVKEFRHSVINFKIPKIYKFLADCSVENGYLLRPSHYLFGVSLLKNDKIFASSDIKKPMEKGFLSQALYQNIVQDVAGTGASIITLRFHIQLLTDEVLAKDVFFVYKDMPRKAEHQNRDHYLKVCKRLQPFIDVVDPLFNSLGYQIQNSEAVRTEKAFSQLAEGLKWVADRVSKEPDTDSGA
jgi:hypothetical protein